MPSPEPGRVQEVARVMPELLDRPVSAIGDDDVFAFIKARAASAMRALLASGVSTASLYL